jgi:hypothetical protein
MSVQDREIFSNVLRAIEELPEPQRDVLVLAFDQELRHEQIAVILDCSVAAVKVRIHRARLQFADTRPKKTYARQVAFFFVLYTPGYPGTTAAAGLRSFHPSSSPRRDRAFRRH